VTLPRGLGAVEEVGGWGGGRGGGTVEDAHEPFVVAQRESHFEYLRPVQKYLRAVLVLKYLLY
jgi:hypothetical protein